MALKGQDALHVLQREVQDIRKKVDGLTTDMRLNSGSDEETIRRCQELQMWAEKTLRTLKKLATTKEAALIPNFEQIKLLEERRLHNTLEQINTLFLHVSPPGPSATTDINSDDDDDDDDEDDDDDDEDDDENDNSEDNEGDGDTDNESEKGPLKSPSQSDPHIYTAMFDLKAEQEGDLSLQKGDVLRIIKMSSENWWLAQDSKGNVGVVPNNYLQAGSTLDDDDESNEEDQSGEEEQDSEELFADGEKESRKASNWDTVRKALTEIDATDVLSAMGAIPSGFRTSTLHKLLTEEGITYRASHHIQPELSQSQLSFNDLFLDPDTGKVRAREVRTCVCFTLWSCRMIPTPGVGLQVLSRHVRMCASDGTRVLSNIHTVRATYSPRSPKTWSFSPQTTGILPSLLNGNCFLRCSSASPELGILFELGVTFIRNSTGERGEMSCGWAFLKLTDDSGNPIPNRTYDLQVNGGTPYEKDVAVEAPVMRGSPTGVFKQMFQMRQQPKLIVKLKLASGQIRTELSVLPDTLLHGLSCVHLLALHRQLLADTLLLDRLTMQTADFMCNPVLSTFPLLLDQTDLLDALMSAWLDAENNMSRSQKKDLSFWKKEFVKVYMSSIYFLLHSPSLPPHCWADPSSEEQRARVIYDTLNSLKHNQNTNSHSGGLKVFVDPSCQHLAFDVSELTFDLLGVAR